MRQTKSPLVKAGCDLDRKGLTTVEVETRLRMLADKSVVIYF